MWFLGLITFWLVCGYFAARIYIYDEKTSSDFSYGFAVALFLSGTFSLIFAMCIAKVTSTGRAFGLTLHEKSMSIFLSKFFRVKD